MDSPQTELLDALTSESAWLHGLARRLARDPERAADAAQRTLLTALEHRPEERGSLRAWLATVLRRALREEQRGDRRRAEREALARDPRSTPTPEETLARLDVQQRVVAAIRALDEPYRSTLVQRFLDGRSVREIARRSEVPAKTVHTRVERGLARLRARLDFEHGGDRSAWLGALVVFRFDSVGILSKGVGAMQVGTKAIAATVALVVVLGSTAWLLTRDDPAAEIEPASVVAVPRLDQVAFDPVPFAEESVESERSALITAPMSDEETVVAAAPPRVHGRVEDALGGPIVGARVRYVDESGAPVALEPTLTDARGAFALPPYEYAAYLNAEREGYATLARPYVTIHSPTEELVIVLVPAEAVAGLVVDEAGVPVAGARVRVVFPDSAFHASSGGRWVFGRSPYESRSDSPSGFRIEAVPLTPGARVSAELDGYLPAALELDDADRSALELVLRSTSGDAPIVFGVVLDARGAPVEGAHVSDGHVTVGTDAQGRFVLELRAPLDEVELCAILRGAGPARRKVARTAEGFPSVTLRLGEKPLTIRGRVLDEDGEPLNGAIVKLLDPTPFGVLVAEHGGQRYETWRQVEELATPADAVGAGHTNLFGSEFALYGLLPRSYQLIALDRHTLACVGPVEVQAGSSGVELRLVGLGPRRVVAGRVVSRHGAPIADVGVRLGRHLAGTRLADAGAAEVKTDVDGRFTLDAFHVRGGYLVFSARQFASTFTIELDEHRDLEALELVAGVDCNVRVICDDPAFADELVFLDHHGEPLRTCVEAPGALFIRARSPLTAGDSGSLIADDRADHLVLFLDGEEVYRRAVELSPGAEIELRVH